MSVIIPGVKIPERCDVCQFLDGDEGEGVCYAANKWLDDEYFAWYQYEEGDMDLSKPLNCPLIEIPTAHGRLIDADALMESVKTVDYIYRKVFRWLIDHALTIIEAEEVEK